MKKYFCEIVALLLIIATMLHIIHNGSTGKLEQRIESELEYYTGEIEEQKSIRVLLLSTDYRSTAHPIARLSAKSGLVISYGGIEEKWESSEIISLEPNDKRFVDSKVSIKPFNSSEEICVENIERSYGNPYYSGTIELRTTAEGIVMINQLLLEDYLCKVVPSEMPASYEKEALKAQAVCARSYAYRQTQKYGYPEYEAHVDDSTKYQVYNNSPSQESSTQAVKETVGEVVWYKGEVATTYYYSTSGGKTTDIRAWGSKVHEKNAYLQSIEVKDRNGDYEKMLPWYRWTADIPVQTLSDLVGLNTGTDVGEIQNITVSKRGAGDVALQIIIEGNQGTVTIDTENKIRTALGGSGYTITKNDGTVSNSTGLLPSAFFTVKKEGTMFHIEGGGLGHGIGMSQNGANEMAKAGKTYKEILQTFYQGVTIE